MLARKLSESLTGADKAILLSILFGAFLAVLGLGQMGVIAALSGSALVIIHGIHLNAFIAKNQLIEAELRDMLRD